MAFGHDARRAIHAEVSTMVASSVSEAASARVVGTREVAALDTGPGIGGGIVGCSTQLSLWLPYVEVARSPTRRAC
jgi:hypothetical protein